MSKFHQLQGRFGEYVIDFVLDCLRQGEAVALVTLVKIEGSSPRPLGAQMAVSASGAWCGYLSGGCIERAVVTEALCALERGSGCLVRYGKGSRYVDIQLPCGSAIELVFDIHPREEDLARVNNSLANRKPASLRVWMPGDGRADGGLVRHYWPKPRLIICGVGPAALWLARAGAQWGFETLLRSPDLPTRQAAASEDIATASIHPESADMDADAYSAVVFMFHDHEWERNLLPAALKTQAFYIGAMGGRRTHERRLLELELSGVSLADRCRVRGPAGLFPRAKSAPDIALSILAEIVQAQQEGAGDAMLERTASVPR